MCSNYIPVTNGDELLAFFGVQRDFAGEAPPEAYPTNLAPFIRLVGTKRTADAGHFGLLPSWRREVKFGTHTYNARSETVDSLPSYRDSWRRGLRCVVPAKAVYEPKYFDDGTNERWCIEKEDGTPFGIAGVYSTWSENGEEKFSFSMLTVNCDDHPFYRQFHQPGKEKRMPVFLDAQDYDAWMSGTEREVRDLIRQWPGPFRGFPAPRPGRTAKEPKTPTPKASRVPRPTAAPKPPPAQGDLF